MPLTKLPMRYGHTEGHTDVCFDDTGSCIVTCGSDGDVRIWQNLDDDDPKSISVGEKAYSFALKNGKLVTAVSNNTVQIHTYPDGSPDGILTRFTTNANHVVFNDDGRQVAAGSSDFLVKVVQVSDSSQQKTFRGHDAPVLSLSFDPQNAFVASASCDGSVRVWDIEKQTCAIHWDLLQKCNDVVNAKSICRLAWQPNNGKLLAVPVQTSVKLYERQSWLNQTDLSDDFIAQTLNVVSWSRCGEFIAAGTIDGHIAVWSVKTKQCIEKVKHEKGYTICALAWHPKGGQIVYTDTEGNVGLLDNVCNAGEKAPASKLSSAIAKDYDDLFDGDDDDEDFLNKDPVEPQDEDEDGPMPISGRTRIRGPLLDDDDNSLDFTFYFTLLTRLTCHTPMGLRAHTKRDIPLIKGSTNREKVVDEDDDGDGVSSLQKVLPTVPPKPSYDGPMPTPRQKAFQSGSTPSHLMHRFMVWNSVGVIRCYNDEQDNAIDVEFHDTSVHHAIHLTNTLNHTIADMSIEAVLLACVSTEELQSKLQCLHFSSWDTNKEWTVDMPKNEDIQAVCLGQGWVACATSSLLLQVFTVGGVQREIISLLGPVVSMAGHGEQLLITYHCGMGFDGDQCLGVQLLELGKRKCQVLHGEPLSLGRKAYLTWVGFSAEGTPCYVDSDGVVRMLNRGFGNTWAPICDVREYCKAKSDHYWVVGIHENPQQLRCIPCKGARFPPTLPRPAVAVLQFKLPYCQITTEKGQMEEQFWRSVVFNHHIGYLSQNDYECDESVKTQKEQQELLMKMFALSCKLEREFRCIELAEFMTPNAMNLAIKYASRSKKLILAQRLSELALEKAAELAAAQQRQEEEEVELEEDFRSRLNAGYSRTSTEWNEPRVRSNQHDRMEATEVAEAEDDEVEPERPAEMQKQRLNPFRKSSNSIEETTPKLEVTVTPSNQGRVNPFKVSAKQKSPGFAGGGARSSNILDNMSTLSRRPVTSVNGTSNKQKSLEIKPLMPKPKSKQGQATLFQMVIPKTDSKKIEEKESKDENSLPEKTVPAAKPKTGFQLWLDDNRASILSENPDLEESEVIKEGMSRFRLLSPEERIQWTDKAKGGQIVDANEAADAKKRKRPADENEGQKENQATDNEDTGLANKH